MLAIVTESEFVVQTWTEEGAKKNEKTGRIFSDSILPRSKNCEKFLDTNYSFKLMPGIKDKNQVKGVYAGIKGIAYRVYPSGGNPFFNPKEYPLEGYIIPCIITKNREVYPIMRNAKYDEKWIHVTKDDYLQTKQVPKNKLKEVVSDSLNKDWPTLLEI